MKHVSILFEAHDISDSIATCYRMDGPGIKFQWGWDFAHLSRSTLGPTQPPIQWVPRLPWG